MESNKLEQIKLFLTLDKNRLLSDYFRTVKKSSQRTDLTAIPNAMKVKGIESPNYEVIRSFFKELENFGLGKLSRYNSLYKFEWREPYSMVFLRKVILEEQINFEPEAKSDLEDIVKKEDFLEKEHENEKCDLINYDFMLRSDLRVTLSLPKNLTHGESERLQSFLKTLPF